MILPAASLHAGVLARIHHHCFPLHQAWSETAFASLLATPNVLGWLDDRGGFILYRRAADEADLLTLAVLPAHRRTGIAAALLATSLAALAADRTGQIYLEVAADNHAALALYQRGGFAPVGRRPGYYADGSDAVLMRRALA